MKKTSLITKKRISRFPQEYTVIQEKLNRLQIYVVWSLIAAAYTAFVYIWDPWYTYAMIGAYCVTEYTKTSAAQSWKERIMFNMRILIYTAAIVILCCLCEKVLLMLKLLFLESLEQLIILLEP